MMVFGRRSIPVRRRWVTVVCALALSGLIGCGSSSDEEEAPGPETFAKERAKLRAEVQCRAERDRCEGRPPGSRAAEGVDACQKRLVEDWESGPEGKRALGTDPELFAALEGGFVEYNADAAQECLGKLRSYVGNLSCTQVHRLKGLFVADALDRYLYPVCEEVWRPTLGEGERCGTSEACEGQLQCLSSGEGCGTCRSAEETRYRVRTYSFSNEGGGCGGPNHDPICNPTEDIVCSRTSEGRRWECIRARSRAKGEPCGPGACEAGLVCRKGECKSFEVVDEGNRCGEPEEYCGEGLLCRAISEERRECRPPGEVGDSCSVQSECSEGLRCDHRLDGARYAQVGACREYGEKGESCEGRDECEEGLFCDENRLVGEEAVCRSLLDEGDRCMRRACGEGLRCRYEPSTRRQSCQRISSGGGDDERLQPVDSCRR